MSSSGFGRKIILRPRFTEDKIHELQHDIESLGLGEVLLVTGVQGIGKTTLAVNIVADHLLDEPEAKIAVIIPNHDFSKEWEWGFNPDQYNHWYGRAQIVDGIPMCTMRDHPLIRPFIIEYRARGSFMCQMCHGKALLALSNLSDKCPYAKQFEKDSSSSIVFAVHQYINMKKLETFKPTWVISDDVQLETLYQLPSKAEQKGFIGAFNLLQLERAEKDDKYTPYTVDFDQIDEDTVGKVNQKLRGMFGWFYRQVASGEEILEHEYWRVLIKVDPSDILTHRFMEEALGQEHDQLHIPYLYKLFDLSYQGVKVVIIRATGQAKIHKLATRTYAHIFKKIPRVKEYPPLTPDEPITSQIKRVVGNIHDKGAWYPPTSFEYKETQKIIKTKTTFLIDRDKPKSIGIVTFKALKEINKVTNKMKVFGFLPNGIPEDMVEVLHFNALDGKNNLHLADGCLRIGTYQHHLVDVVELFNSWTGQQLDPKEEIDNSYKKKGTPGRVFNNHDLEQFRKQQNALRNNDADGRFRLHVRPNKMEYVFGVVYPEMQKTIPTTNVKIHMRDGMMVEEEYHDFNNLIKVRLAEYDDLYPVKYLTAYLMSETQLSYEPVWRRIKEFVEDNERYNIYRIKYDGRMRRCLAREGRQW